MQCELRRAKSVDGRTAPSHRLIAQHQDQHPTLIYDYFGGGLDAWNNGSGVQGQESDILSFHYLFNISLVERLKDGQS